MGTIRVSLDLGIGKIEIEGSTVKEVLAHLKSLPDALPDLSDQINQVRIALPKPSGMKGVKLTDLIRQLKKRRWFKKPRDAGETMKKLHKMGVPANKRMITSSLMWLVRNGELNRKKEKNRIVYFRLPSVVKL